MIAQAQSGTGKTATFSVSILQSIDTTIRETQVLCLSPTRELAVQIQKVVLALGDYMNVQCHSCIGGTNLGEDIRKLDYGQHVVSGTPGRVFDMIRRRTLRTRWVFNHNSPPDLDLSLLSLPGESRCWSWTRPTRC